MPHLVMEEYLFDVDGLEDRVKGRILKSVGLNEEFWAWETSHTDSRHVLRHCNSLETAREQLFGYMDGFKPASVKKDNYY